MKTQKTLKTALAHKLQSGTSIACYATRSGFSCHVKLPVALARKLDFGLDSRVKVECKEDATAGGVRTLRFTIREDRNGVALGKSGAKLLAQVSNLLPAAMPTTEVRVIRKRRGYILVEVAMLAPVANDNAAPKKVRRGRKSAKDVQIPATLSDLTSLTMDPGAARRLRMLAGNDNVRTTSAGDQCYTARFIIDAVLRAAERSVFCIDVCSMRTDGRYDLEPPVSRRLRRMAKAQRRGGKERAEEKDKSCWGSTPKVLRDPAKVIGHVPAKRYFTNDRSFGALTQPWLGNVIWLNPPYSLRAWTTFLEYAHREVEEGRAGIVVALVPCDNSGAHNRHFYGEHAYRIELARQIPFFKREKRDKSGKTVVAENVIDVIRGNQFVVFGKGEKVRRFLRRFLDELLAIDYITEQHRRRYHVLFDLDEGEREHRAA